MPCLLQCTKSVHCWKKFATPPDLLQESLGPFGPEVSRECPSGCLWGPSGPGLQSVQKVSGECPWSVGNTFLTLRGHSRETFLDTPDFGPEGPQRHPEGHSCSRSGGLQKRVLKTIKSIRKMVWKTRKRIRKTIRNAFEKCLAPLRPLKNISPALSTNFKSFSPPKICTKKSFLHREALQEWPRQPFTMHQICTLLGYTVKKRVLRRVLRRGSEKGVSRRCLERPLVEYAPLGVRPTVAGRGGCKKECQKQCSMNFCAAPFFRPLVGGSAICRQYREVLHGVGADGVGVKFPIFAVKIAVVCPCPLGEAGKIMR